MDLGLLGTAELLGEPLTLVAVRPARHRLESSCTVRFVVMCTGGLFMILLGIS